MDHTAENVGDKEKGDLLLKRTLRLTTAGKESKSGSIAAI